MTVSGVSFYSYETLELRFERVYNRLFRYKFAITAVLANSLNHLRCCYLKSRFRYKIPVAVASVISLNHLKRIFSAPECYDGRRSISKAYIFSDNSNQRISFSSMASISSCNFKDCLSISSPSQFSVANLFCKASFCFSSLAISFSRFLCSFCS